MTERSEGLAGVRVSAAGPLAQGFRLTRYKGGLLVNCWNFVNMFHFLSESFILLISEKCKITFENC